jgi:hypothetical protein
VASFAFRDLTSMRPVIHRLSAEPDVRMSSAPAGIEHVPTDPGTPLEPVLRQDTEEGLQTKVGVSKPGEAYEQEADRIADQVLAKPAHPDRTTPSRLQRFSRQSSGQMVAALASVEHALANPGKPLEPPLRQEMETPKAGLIRTLYVVQNDVWSKLPSAVRANAEQELNGLFAFVGASSTEKPFSVSIVEAAKLPEQFDFSESVVSVIHGDAAKYVKEAFARQDAQIRRFMAGQNLQKPAAPAAGKDPLGPEKIGFGGGSRAVRTDQGRTFALPVMAGAVNIDEVIASFLENLDSLLQDQMAALPSKANDPTKWPATVKRGSSSWQPLVMLGQALGRAIAHEARHEYLGSGHAETGLGEDAPYLTGEKTTAQFSKADQKAILERIRTLEAMQGTATVVPTFPQSMRQKPEDFPF